LHTKLFTYTYKCLLSLMSFPIAISAVTKFNSAMADNSARNSGSPFQDDRHNGGGAASIPVAQEHTPPASILGSPPNMASPAPHSQGTKRKPSESAPQMHSSALQEGSYYNGTNHPPSSTPTVRPHKRTKHNGSPLPDGSLQHSMPIFSTFDQQPAINTTGNPPAPVSASNATSLASSPSKTTVAAAILRRHWEDFQRYAPDAGYRVSALRRFLRSVKDCEVLVLTLEISIQMPNILPTACRESRDAFHSVGCQWLEEVTLVFTGDFYRFKAAEERDSFIELMAHLSAPGDLAAPHVKRISIPGFSKSRPGAFAKIFNDCTGLEELVVGIHGDEKSISTRADTYIERTGILALARASSLRKVTLVKAPSAAKIDQERFNEWLDELGSYTKQMLLRGNGLPQVFVDKSDLWQSRAEPAPAEV